MMLRLRVAARITVGMMFALGCSARAPARNVDANAALGRGAAASRAVRAAADAWTRAALARDAAEMTRYFAEDAFVMYPQPQPTVGRAANGAAWARVFARPGADHPLTTDSVVVAASGDLAFTMGRWALNTPADSTRAAVASGGRYVAIWRSVGPDGAWQIVVLSANTHRPRPEM